MMKRIWSTRATLLAAAGAAVLALAACSSASPTATPVPAAPTPGSAAALVNPAGGQASTNTSGTAGLVSREGLQVAPSACCADPSAYQQKGIHVQGLGSVVVKPDVGMLSLGVEARESTVAAARGKAAAAMDAVLKALRDRGIEDKEIQTQFFNIQPIIEYRDSGIRGGNQTAVITGYLVNNSVNVKLRKLEQMGDVIDDVVKAGGDSIRIHNVAFTIDDSKPLEAKARDLAVRDATAKAQQMAQAAGVKAGPPVFISEYGGSPVIYRTEQKIAPAAASDAGFATHIKPGETQVTISVQMVFPIN